MSLAFPLADAFSFPSVADTTPDVGERGSRVTGDLWAETGTIANVTIRGKATISESGAIRSGQTNYDDGIGFWMEAHDPSSPTGNPRFSLGNSAGNKMLWTGTALQITGSITATSGTIGGWTINSTTITGGSVTLDSAGNIRAGQTAYATGSGFWLGVDSGTPKFSIGNTATGNYLTWNGTTLTVAGSITVGSIAISSVTGGTFGGTYTSAGSNPKVEISTTGIKTYNGAGTTTTFLDGANARFSWGNDYVSNNLMHFELGTGETAKMEFKNGSNTTYGQVTANVESTVGMLGLYGYYSSTNNASISITGHNGDASVGIVATGGNNVTAVTITGHGTSASNIIQFRADDTDVMKITPTAVNVQAAGLILSGGSIHSSGATGAMPNPTKYLVLSDGSNFYYAPLFSAVANWAA